MQLQSLLPTAIMEATCSEWADTPEKEQEIGLNGAISAIKKHREQRMSDNTKRLYAQKLFEKDNKIQYTCEQLFDKLQKDFPNYKLDEFNEPIFRKMCIYVTRDEKKAKECGIDLNKGIMIMGNKGVGKSRLMQIFANNQSQSYILKNCKEISDEYFKAKHEQVTLMENYFGSTICFGAGNYQQSQLGFCFEDLGTDNTDAIYYGNKENVLANIFLARYDRLIVTKTITPQMTHITTNLMSGDEIESRYGTRIRDRFREMFNQIVWDKNAPSRRK